MRTRSTIVVVVAAVAAAVAGGCKKKQPAERYDRVAVAALAAIPADASVVVGMDVAQLAQAAVVVRAVDQMLVRDPELAARLARLATDCGVDVARQIKTVHLALGPRAPGKGSAVPPSLLVATGQLSEPALTRCLQAGTGSGGGELSVRDVGGRPLYKLTEGARVLHLAFGQDDTVVIGADEGWVLAAVGSGAKVTTSKELGPLLAQVDRSAALWAVAVMDAELGQALSRVTGGKVGASPRALHGALDTRSGLAGTVAFAMATEGDAEALVGFARDEIQLLALAAQTLGLGRVVAKVRVERKGSEAQFRVALTDDEVRQVLSAIDRGQVSGQDAQPFNADAVDASIAAPGGDASTDAFVDAPRDAP